MLSCNCTLPYTNPDVCKTCSVYLNYYEEISEEISEEIYEEIYEEIIKEISEKVENTEKSN